MSSMRYVWTDATDDPSWEIGDAHGINGYFAPAFDSITPAVVDEAARRGHIHGVYVGHGWISGDVASYVKQVNDYIKPLKAKHPGLRLQLNMEESDPALILARLKAMRALQPGIGLSWSLEGMKGGLFATQGMADWIVQLKVRVVPEGFWGAGGRMDGIFDSNGLVLDLAPIPASLISPMIDAKFSNILRGWRGYAFTMGRLNVQAVAS
jgi:hypothetical protein